MSIPIALVPHLKQVEVLRDIVVPKRFYTRLNLGIQILDEVFGGVEMPGIFPGSSLLFTGAPGAGKSTLALQLADLLTKNTQRNVLYNAGEEVRPMIKIRADRIGILGNFCISSYEDVDELIEYCKRSGVEILFQDSIQTLRDRDLRGKALLESVVKKLHGYTKETDSTAFLIGHVTKGGVFAGPNEIKHDTDVHVHLGLDQETGNRVLELQKNRFGPAGIPYEFALSAAGLDFQQVSQKDGDGKQVNVSRAADRRERIKKLIKDKLLEGEKISGYCFERLEVDCSGGFWRGMCSLASRELIAEGKKIGEKKIDGRLFIYVEDLGK
jgi:predicted ATP-dependent serine protease